MSASPKTKTSTAAKRRYNDKAYSRIQVELPKDTVSAFRAKCTERDVSQASVVLTGIERFLAEE